MITGLPCAILKEEFRIESKKYFGVGCLSLVFFCFGNSLFAKNQSGAENEAKPVIYDWDFGGFIRSEAHVPVETEDESETALGLTGEITTRLFFNDNFSAHADLRARLYDLSRDTEKKLDFREGYLRFSGNFLDISIGQQITAWGRAVGPARRWETSCRFGSAAGRLAKLPNRFCRSLRPTVCGIRYSPTSAAFFQPLKDRQKSTVCRCLTVAHG